jgi:hypothetical protein
MWCSSCRQEVPGLVDGLDGRYACPRCGAVLLNDAGIDLSSDPAALQVARAAVRETLATPTSANDLDEPVFEPLKPAKPEPSRVTSLRWEAANWELNEKLRHVERVTAVARRRYDVPTPPTAAGPHAAWTAASFPPASPTAPVHAGWPTAYAAPPHQTNPYVAAPYPTPQPPPPDHHERNAAVGGAAQLIASLVSWIFIGGAICAFSCGGFLAAWGGMNQRPEVQQLGMPIVLFGVLLLVIGLLPQLFLRRLEEQAAWDVDDRRRRAAGGPPMPHYGATSHYADHERR